MSTTTATHDRSTTQAPAVEPPLTFEAVVAAGEVVGRHLAPTPLGAHPLLDRAVGTAVLVKHEHVLPTGSFKVRGGVHLAASLTDRERSAGLVTCSTGNHAQSVAYAARLAGCAVTVVMPASAPQVKRDAVDALGARVVVHGESLDQAAAHARRLAGAADAAGAAPAYVDTTDPRIILGHATAYLELFRQAPDLATVLVPVGSGTGAVGACLVRDALAPGCRVVGVQSSAAPAVHRSWRAGRVESAPATTRASGLATASGYPRTLPVLLRGLQDFVLVSDDEIDAAARLLATTAHTLAEGAGAAALAGLVASPVSRSADGSVADGPVAVVCTGGNASVDEIARLAAG
ncbi:pyridoxal-phosphate dependent enzyme [Nocardioides sp. TF02-7]|uniref:threonine ammonia-lyase n=1 Tax=Nocardioides sp. TF02-7 TaxID=2917724 RepID=UPI001F052E12|nr:pyridoxal-phosphate dependent enzyme [Nocardioides sp. TF02-7]UMG93216.1 pyridoxal-phosphate dependent enzyme [Nocardioides sp. TF02-7]